MGLQLKSPLAKIPFGKYKGVVMWQAPMSWFRWAAEQDPDDTTIDVLADALLLKESEGQYAVIRKSKTIKFLYRVKSVHTMMIYAEAACKDTQEWSEYVYSILKPVNDGR